MTSDSVPRAASLLLCVLAVMIEPAIVARASRAQETFRSGVVLLTIDVQITPARDAPLRELAAGHIGRASAPRRGIRPSESSATGSGLRRWVHLRIPSQDGSAHRPLSARDSTGRHGSLGQRGHGEGGRLGLCDAMARVATAHSVGVGLSAALQLPLGERRTRTELQAAFKRGRAARETTACQPKPRAGLAPRRLRKTDRGRST